MTKVLNFSTVEILPALLDKSKVQTIRPAWKPCIHSTKDKLCRMIEKPARFKVGERVQIHWKSRAAPKDALFCNRCGDLLTGQIFHKCYEDISFDNIIKLYAFPKKLGEAEITEVFKIELKIFTALTVEEVEYWDRIAHLDGFNSFVAMFDWFDKHYGLDVAKEFWVYRYDWLGENDG